MSEPRKFKNLHIDTNVTLEDDYIMITLRVPRRGLTQSEQELIRKFGSEVMSALITKFAGGLFKSSK